MVTAGERSFDSDERPEVTGRDSHVVTLGHEVFA